MKYMDRVRVISNKYEKEGIKYGDEGHILNAEIRGSTFNFYREDPITYADDISAPIEISDLELVTDYNASDESILRALPTKELEWWCKVEDGYIINLKGERRNKVPYDYDS